MTSETGDIKAHRVIKRYPNRKLYDTEQSCYITLRGVSELIRAGEEVQIVDNTTGMDITHEILMQIIRADERKWSLFPISSLVALIRSGNVLSNLRSEIDARMQLPEKTELRAMLESFLTRFEEWQSRVEKQIQALWEVPQNLMNKEVEVLRERIAQLEKKVADLKGRLERDKK